MSSTIRLSPYTPQCPKSGYDLSKLQIPPSSLSATPRSQPDADKKNAILSKTFENSELFSSSKNKTSFHSRTRDSDTPLSTIVAGICTALTCHAHSQSHCRSVSFAPRGCVWTTLLSTGGDDDDDVDADYEGEDYSHAGAYWMKIVCWEISPEERNALPDKFCCERGQYQIEMLLLSPGGGGNVMERATTKGKVEKIFQTISFAVKKEIIRCDLPVFPEGDSGKTFREVYQLNAEIKAGAFAKVMQGTHRASGRKVAAKCVFREKLSPQDDAAIFDEVAIMAYLDHKYIVSLIDFFEEPEWYILVMDLATGGDLFDRIGEKKNYSEKDARNLSRVLLTAVAFIHENGIAHCDLKPKNLVLVDPDADSDIMVTDFGFASRVFTPKSLTRQCGTPLFVAPEVLKKEAYDQAADMWSVGVIIYLLLGGTLPFLAANLKSLFQKIVAGKYEFNDKYWANVSADAKEFIKKLLVVDPEKRMTAREALGQRWIRVSDSRSLMRNDLTASARELKTFNAKMKLRAAIFAVDWIGAALDLSRKKSGTEQDQEEYDDDYDDDFFDKQKEKQRKEEEELEKQGSG